MFICGIRRLRSKKNRKPGLGGFQWGKVILDGVPVRQGDD